GQERLQRRARLAVAQRQRQRWRRLVAELRGLRVARVGGAAQFDPVALVEAFAQGVGGHPQLVWRQDRAFDVVAQLLVAVAGLLPEMIGRLQRALVDQRQGARREVVEQARGGVEEQRQVVLDAGRRDAGL